MYTYTCKSITSVKNIFLCYNRHPKGLIDVRRLKFLKIGDFKELFKYSSYISIVNINVQ